MRTVLLSVLVLFSSTSLLASDGIPTSCQAEDRPARLKVIDGILEVVPHIQAGGGCIGVRGSDGSVSCTIPIRARCVSQPSTFWTSFGGQDHSIVGEQNLCQRIYDLALAQDFPNLHVSCLLTRTMTSAPVGCGEIQNSVSLEMYRNSTDLEIKQQKCKALSGCLEGNDLSRRERRSANDWVNTLKCDHEP